MSIIDLKRTIVVKAVNSAWILTFRGFNVVTFNIVRSIETCWIFYTSCKYVCRIFRLLSFLLNFCIVQSITRLFFKERLRLTCKYIILIFIKLFYFEFIFNFIRFAKKFRIVKFNLFCSSQKYIFVRQQKIILLLFILFIVFIVFLINRWIKKCCHKRVEGFIAILADFLFYFDGAWFFLLTIFIRYFLWRKKCLTENVLFERLKCLLFRLLKSFILYHRLGLLLEILAFNLDDIVCTNSIPSI